MTSLSELIANRGAVRLNILRATIHLVTARDCLRLRPLLQPVLDLVPEALEEPVLRPSKERGAELAARPRRGKRAPGHVCVGTYFHG